MSWLVPENMLDGSTRNIIDYDLSETSICISGNMDCGKSLTLMYLSGKIIRLNNSSRILVLVYRNIEVEKFKRSFSEIGIKIKVLTYWQFRKESSHYDYILCDDVQLISQSLLTEIKKVTNHIIVTINPNLKIFDLDPQTQEPLLTIEQVRETLHPKEFELIYNHHNYDGYIIGLSELILNKDLIKPIINSRQCQQVRICEASCVNEEVQFIIKESEKCLRCGFTSAILLATNRDMLNFAQALIKQEGKDPWNEVLNKWGRIDYNSLNQYLISNDINYQCLGSSYGQLSDLENKINIMTYHGSMGFKYDNVFLPYVNSSLYISPSDEVSKNVFVLAMTRALHNLYLVFSGSMHPYLLLIKDKCVRLHCIDSINSNMNNDNIFAI
jgi:hypothetical protein